MRSMDQIDMKTSDLFDSGTRVNPLHESNLVDQDSTAYFANCVSETIAWNNVISTLATRTGVVAQMPVAAEVGSGDERDELGSG